MLIPDCETSGMSGTGLHLSHILSTYWGSFASVSGGVGSRGGWWILRQPYTTCSAVYSSTLHFLLMLSTAHVILCSQYLRSG